MYKGKSVIAICTSELDRKFELRLLDRIIYELRNQGHYVFVFGTDRNLWNYSSIDNSENDRGEAALFDLLSWDSVDIILLMSETIKSEELLKKIVRDAEANDKVVMSMGIELEGCYNVVYDMNSAFEKIVRHVIEYHDLKEVNFIAGVEGNSYSEERLEIYKTVMEDNDLLVEEDRIGYGDFWSEPTKKVMDKFMDPSKTPPEAIICANDSMAITVTDYLRDLGVKVPEEIIVTGLDGIYEGIEHSPGITTASRDEVNDAKIVADLLNSLSKGERISAYTSIDYHIRLSESCGCQMEHIFNSDLVIKDRNDIIHADWADFHYYTEMSADLLAAGTQEDFLKIIEKDMPNRSFIALNEDLYFESGENNHKAGNNPFSEALNAFVKIDGKLHKSMCYAEHVVPELLKDPQNDDVLLIMPLHFEDKVVGYWGIYTHGGNFLEITRDLHFIMAFNSSATYKFSKK